MQLVSKMLLNILTLGNKRVVAMALWPFIIYRDRDCSKDARIRNHELIHHRQQKELLIIPYYFCYFAEYWIAMFRNGFRHHQAYLNVSFEQEAFAHEKDLNYLEVRRFFASRKYLFNKFGHHDKGKKNKAKF